MRALALAVAIALIPATTLAQTGGTASAEASFRRGIEAMQGAHYADAVVAFRESYRLHAVPTVLYNLALAYRALGQNLAAIETFQQYLHDAGNTVEPARAEAIRATLVTLRDACGVVALELYPDGTTVTVDGRAPLYSPNGRALLVDPGEHVVRVERENYVARSEMVRVGARQRVTLAVTLDAMPAPAPAPPTFACTPGAQIPCACADDAHGFQRCNAAGTALSVCACPLGTPDQRESHWYGWQILIVDGAALGVSLLALANATELAYAGVSMFALGGPIVHWAHGQVGTGFGSFGVRLVIPGGGALIGYFAGGGGAVGTIFGASLGGAAAIALDVAVFARVSRPVLRRTPLAFGGLTPLPGGALLSVGGTF